MRQAIVRSLVGPLCGYVACVGAALWLRWAVPQADFVWNAVSPLRIGSWFLTLAHGVPLVVRSVAGINAPDAPGSIGRLSELLGGSSDVVFSFSVVLIPLTILAITGIVTAVAVRWAAPSTARDVALWAVLCAVVHGAVLALAAQLASIEFAVEGNLAPDLGLGEATGRIAIGLGSRAIVAFALGAGWGAAFAFAGGMSALPMRRTIDAPTRVLMLGWMNGLGVAAGAIAVVLGLGGLVALVMGRAPKPSLIALGGFMLAANAVAAGVVFVHGVSMAVALDAGPFTGWERVDLLNVGTSGGAAPPPVWLVVIVPIAAGVVAGRFVRRRSTRPPVAIALRFGVLWGLTLAMLSLLLRVRVLSSLSVGSLDLGGGSAAFEPLVALVIGFAWGVPSAFIGARTATSTLWTCPSCGMSNAESDRFCVSCGAPSGASVSAR